MALACFKSLGAIRNMYGLHGVEVKHERAAWSGCGIGMTNANSCGRFVFAGKFVNRANSDRDVREQGRIVNRIRKQRRCFRRSLCVFTGVIVCVRRLVSECESQALPNRRLGV